MSGIQKILVIGGSGFVGSHICKAALAAGFQVISLSPSGRKTGEKWADDVKWLQGSALNPSSYRDYIGEISGIVHSVGILLDLNAMLLGMAQQQYYEKSYEQINRDTAIIPAQELIDYKLENQDSPKKHFIYISAERGVLVAPRFLSSKREAESFLTTNHEMDLLTTTIFRPGYIYTDESKYSELMASAFKVMNWQDTVYKYAGMEKISEKLIPAKPVDVHKIANACIQALTDQEMWGKTISSEEIDHRF